MSKGNWGQGHLKIPYSYERYLIQSLTPLAKKRTQYLCPIPFIILIIPVFKDGMLLPLELECALPTLWA